MNKIFLLILLLLGLISCKESDTDKYIRIHHCKLNTITPNPPEVIMTTRGIFSILHRPVYKYICDATVLTIQ